MFSNEELPNNRHPTREYYAIMKNNDFDLYLPTRKDAYETWLNTEKGSFHNSMHHYFTLLYEKEKGRERKRERFEGSHSCI